MAFWRVDNRDLKYSNCSLKDSNCSSEVRTVLGVTATGFGCSIGRSEIGLLFPIYKLYIYNLKCEFNILIIDDLRRPPNSGFFANRLYIDIIIYYEAVLENQLLIPAVQTS